jgi:Platelet-activating factor acetylhydrolase, isoform II
LAEVLNKHGKFASDIKRMIWRRRLLKIGGVFVATIVLLVGMLVAYVGLSSHQPVVLPQPTGNYQVGRSVYDWVDPSRLDPFSAGGKTPRELSVWVWYPADPAPNATPSAYLPADWAQGLQLGVVQSFIQTSPTLTRPHSFDDAPFAAGAHNPPILIFAPGLGQAAYDYTTTLEDLASHGYVVFAINPTYSTDVVLTGGRFISSVNRARGENADLNQLVELWAADMHFVLSRVQLLDTDSADRFAGHLNAGHVGFFGHSLGGAAAAEACFDDASCAGAVDEDGSLCCKVVSQGIGKSFLFVGSQDTLDQPTRAQLRGVLRNDSNIAGHVMTITGTGHFNFSDRGIYFFFLLHQLGAVGSIDGVRALLVTDTYLREFFDASFGGLPSPLLAGPSAEYPEVHFETP